MAVIYVLMCFKYKICFTVYTGETKINDTYLLTYKDQGQNNVMLYGNLVSSKICDKWDNYNFEIVNFPFLDGVVPRSPSYGVYISQLIRFARMCSNVDDFNNRNLFLTAKL